MKLFKAVLPCFLFAALTGSALADSTIKATLAEMSIIVDHDKVPAGKVTFDVTNTSKQTIHEMLVAPITGPGVTMPFNVIESRVDEAVSGDLGEVSELAAGKSGSLTLDLKPGLYVLYCNIPGHFISGMWKTIEVK